MRSGGEARLFFKYSEEEKETGVIDNLKKNYK
jgi:hypothetical protein